MFQVENEDRAQLPQKKGTSPEQTSALEESIYKISAQLSTVSRNQKYFRTRENRNFSTVRSTEKRIFQFSIIEGFMMVTMAMLQVFIVRFFFQGARKGIRIPLLSQLDSWALILFIGYVWNSFAKSFQFFPLSHYTFNFTVCCIVYKQLTAEYITLY